MSINELHGWNAAINARIADRLQDPDYSTANPVYPVTANLDDYLASLGDGSRPYEGLSTGLDAIDHLIGGLNRFTLLAARAGTGKSTLAVQMSLGSIQT